MRIKMILNNSKLFLILLTLVFCCSNSAFGENLCLRASLGNYARINYAEHLSKGYEVDPDTKTIILTGHEAVSFLLQTKQFHHQTTVCNLGKNPIVMELEGNRLTLENIGAVAIKPQAKLEFKAIMGQVIVIVTQNPDAVNSWYSVYNSENFSWLFAEKGYNKSGIISPEEWTAKGVTVIDSASRKNQWTGANEPEWLIDSMTLGANLTGISMVQYNHDTAGNWIFFNEIRPAEAYHNHPNKPNGNFVEIYYIAEGMAALAFAENGEIKVNIMGPGDMMIVKDEMSHTIIAAKGPYKHLAIQVPSTFQYGFDFKRTLDLPHILQQRIVQSGKLNEILGSSKTGTYVIAEQVDATGMPGIRSISKPSVSLLSSL